MKKEQNDIVVSLIISFETATIYIYLENEGSYAHRLRSCHSIRSRRGQARALARGVRRRRRRYERRVPRCAATRAQEQKSAGNSIDSAWEREKVGRKREGTPRMQSRSDDGSRIVESSNDDEGRRDREREREKERSLLTPIISAGEVARIRNQTCLFARSKLGLGCLWKQCTRPLIASDSFRLV